MRKGRKSPDAACEQAVRFTSVLIAVLLAIVFGGAFIAAAGANPFAAYGVILQGAFGSARAWSETLLRATPLMLAGIGLAVSFRCNLTSIGSEGQIIIGALCAAVVGMQLGSVPPVLAVTLSLLASIAGGAVCGGIAGLLKAKLGISEIICTIMLNYIAINLLSLLLDGALHEPGSSYPQSAELPASVWLPQLFSGNRLHLGFILALIGVAAYYFFMFRMPAGFRIRMVGYNPRTAKYAGVNVAWSVVAAMLISGGMGGLAGGSEVLGIYHRLYNDFAAGVGFDAMAVALLGRLSPTGVVLASIFFAALQTGTSTMQRTIQVPTMIVSVIQGLLILLIYSDKLYAGQIRRLFRRTLFREKREETAA